jgi:hypothetical protein
VEDNWRKEVEDKGRKMMEDEGRKEMEDTENEWRKEMEERGSWELEDGRSKKGGYAAWGGGGGVGGCSVFCLPGPRQTESQTLPHHHREAE